MNRRSTVLRAVAFTLAVVVAVVWFVSDFAPEGQLPGNDFAARGLPASASGGEGSTAIQRPADDESMRKEISAISAPQSAAAAQREIVGRLVPWPDIGSGVAALDGEIAIRIEARYELGEPHPAASWIVSVVEGRFRIGLAETLDGTLHFAEPRLGGGPVHLLDDRVPVRPGVDEIRLRVATAPTLTLRDAETGVELGLAWLAGSSTVVPGARPRWPYPDVSDGSPALLERDAPVPVDALPAGGRTLISAPGYCWQRIGDVHARRGGTVLLRRSGALDLRFHWSAGNARRIELLLRRTPPDTWEYPSYAFAFDSPGSSISREFAAVLEGLEPGTLQFVAALDGDMEHHLATGSVEIVAGIATALGIDFAPAAEVDVEFHLSFEDAADRARARSFRVAATDPLAKPEWKVGRRFDLPDGDEPFAHLGPRPMPPGDYVAVFDFLGLRQAFRIAAEPPIQGVLIELPMLRPVPVRVVGPDGTPEAKAAVLGWRARLDDGDLPDAMVLWHPRLETPAHLPGVVPLPRAPLLDLDLDAGAAGNVALRGVPGGPELELRVPAPRTRIELIAHVDGRPTYVPSDWWHSSFHVVMEDGSTEPAWPSLADHGLLNSPPTTLTRWGAIGGSRATASHGTLWLHPDAVSLVIAGAAPGDPPKTFDAARLRETGGLTIDLTAAPVAGGQ